MTKSSPGFTVATMGMSGCQRLWIISFSYGDLERSTLTNVFGIADSSLGLSVFMESSRLYGEELGDRGLVDSFTNGAVGDTAVFKHQHPVRHVQNKAQDLLANDDAQVAHLADFPQRTRQFLDDRGLDAFCRL